MHKDYRNGLIRAVYPDENRPEWVADDPLAKDAAQRIAELERELTEATTDLEAAIAGAVEVRCKSNDQARAEERERCAQKCEQVREHLAVAGADATAAAQTCADEIRALEGE